VLGAWFWLGFSALIALLPLKLRAFSAAIYLSHPCVFPMFLILLKLQHTLDASWRMTSLVITNLFVIC
jgi:hypothetical protein